MSVLKGTGGAAAATPSAWIGAGFFPDFYLAVVLTAEVTVAMRMTEKPSSVLQTRKLAPLRGLLQLVSMFVEGLTSQVGLLEGGGGNAGRHTGLPFGPSSPGGPLGPAGPAAPGGPASPFSPLSPFGP